jgi:hypothetical protein
MIILEEDEYYCPSSPNHNEGTLFNRIIKLVNAHCQIFKNTFIVRSDKDSKYWIEKITELKCNKNTGFLILDIEIVNYKNIISGLLGQNKWDWLKEERRSRFL